MGLLAWQAGLDVVFVDKDTTLVKTLQRAGHYTVRLFGGGQPQTVNVTGWRVHHYEQRDEIAREILDADLVLTAVFDPNLPERRPHAGASCQVGTCCRSPADTELFGLREYDG